MAKEENANIKDAKIINLQRIYVKDISFEVPRVPEIFKEYQNPNITLNMQNGHRDIGNNIFEGSIKLSVGGKVNGKTAFNLEIVQAGIFELQNLTAPEKEFVLNVTIPTALFPYAREAVDNLMGKASLPPLMMAQVNFEAFFREAKNKSKKSTITVQSPDSKKNIN